ncbi:hypothetical protein CBF45_14075 [Bordetella sp. J329]|nr:hypothetical protein CBF45_14075 [Bordetella sp. J329]
MASRDKTTSVIISTLLGISAVAFNLTASAQAPQESLRDNAQQERRDNPQASPNRPSTQNQPQTHNQHPASSPGNSNQARHGAGPDDRYRKGDTLPQPYQGRRYYVSQPERYNLPAPGHGQRWVKVGADYVLITIATGLIIDLVLNH